MNRLSRRNWIALAALPLAAALLWGCDDGNTDNRRIEQSVDFENGVVITDAWAGQWNVVATFRDCMSGATTIVEDVVDWACPGDTISVSDAGLWAECGGTATGTSIHADCTYQFEDAGCVVNVSMTIDVERDGDAATGSATWSTAAGANCGSEYPVGCETVEITATRLSADVAPCSGQTAAASGLFRALAARALSTARR